MDPRKCVFMTLDTETTGFDPKTDRVCEIGWEYTDWKGASRGVFESLIDPDRAIPPEASAVHGLVDTDVMGKPKLHDLDAPAPFDVFVAHNASFDTQFVPGIADGKPVLCTLKLAQHLWPDLPQHKNQFLRYYFRLDIPEPYGSRMAHSALADAVVTARLLAFEFKEVYSRAKDPEAVTVEGLIEWSNAPRMLTTCRFGNKHYGIPWKDVPRSYLKWMQEKCTDLDADTRFTVERLLQ